MSLDDAGILFLQGDKFLFGFGHAQSYELAYKRYHAAAIAGLPEAQNMLGMFHENGLGKPRDTNTALYWYRLAAERGSLDASNNLGRVYQNGVGCSVDYKQAQSCYATAADAGHVDAMVNLGHMLEKGLGSAVNCVLAFRWYERAAAKEYSKGMNAIGSLYYRGVPGCVDRDAELAVTWFRKSAKLVRARARGMVLTRGQGNAHALNNLGICYEEGQGVSRDLGIAKQMYKDAAGHNHANATNNYGYLLLLERRFDTAFCQFQLALALGSADAAYNLGTLYETGCSYENGEVCLSPDAHMAVKYYKLAAAKVFFYIFYYMYECVCVCICLSI